MCMSFSSYPEGSPKRHSVRFGRLPGQARQHTHGCNDGHEIASWIIPTTERFPCPGAPEGISSTRRLSAGGRLSVEDGHDALPVFSNGAINHLDCNAAVSAAALGSPLASLPFSQSVLPVAGDLGDRRGR